MPSYNLSFKTPRRPRGSDFILEDVDVDEDDEEDGMYSDDDDDIGRELEPNEKEEAERYMKQLDGERRRTERNKFAYVQCLSSLSILIAVE